MAELRDFLLSPEVNVAMATNIEGAKTLVRDEIRKNPQWEQQYGAKYDDIFLSPEKTRAWASRVGQAYVTAGVKEEVKTRTTPQQGLEQPAPAPTHTPDPNLQPPPQEAPTPEVGGGATLAQATPISPLQALKNQEEMFKYLVNTVGRWCSC